MKFFIGMGMLLWVVSCTTYEPQFDYRPLLTAWGGADEAPFPWSAAAPSPLSPPSLSEPSGSTVGRVQAVMDWLGTQVVFDGSVLPPPLDPPVLWDRARAGARLNCLAASTLLASLLEGQGLEARVLWLYPKALSQDNHVVVLAWCGEESRWLVADPSYRTLFYAEGRALGPLDLRSHLASGQRVDLSATASWNDEPVEPDYFNYLAKNLYRFSVAQQGGGRLNLVPTDWVGWGPPWGFGHWTHDPASFFRAP